MNNAIITNFPVAVYGKKEKFSDTISKGRCKVFYKGRNRNGTFITEEFAQKLIQSAPYTPVKGIYEIDDYTDHGQKRSEGRIYGIVPADPNFAWEKHLDSDGIEREYACFDVLYYTALYKEAGEIEGKSESMELYRDTLKGDWKDIDGKRTYVFTDGCFLGLQALGDDVEPCFEGASFYSCENESNIIALLEKYEQKTDLFQYHTQGENETMPSINFKISDSQKHDMLFRLLNPNFNEEGNWTIDYCICEVYEEYAIVANYAEGIFERVYYTKNDENDSLEITNKERCYIIDVNEKERDAIKAIKGESTYEDAAAAYAENAQTIENLNEQIVTLNQAITDHQDTISTLSTSNEAQTATITEIRATVDTLTEENSQYSNKVTELESTISTLTTERDENRANYEAVCGERDALTSEIEEVRATCATVTAERDELAEYRNQVELTAKRAVVENYIEQLESEIIDEFMNSLSDYSVEELDMKLTYELKKANPEIFSKTPTPPTVYIPKEGDVSGISGILAKYEKH